MRNVGAVAAAPVHDLPVARPENFPVALRVLPARIRADLRALYDYARYVDDLGDEPEPDGSEPTRARRLARLDAFAAELEGLYRSVPPRHPVLRRLAEPIARCGLPAEPLLRLIECNRIDQRVDRYERFEDLLHYCHHSADPVGELVLRIFGPVRPHQLALSDRICTALQLIEHLQDVGEDYRRGRIYLPAADLRRFGVPEADLGADTATARLRDLIAFQAERASAWLESGAALVATLRGSARLAVSGYLAGGRAALAGLARAGYDPLRPPVKPRPGQILRHWLFATAWRVG